MGSNHEETRCATSRECGQANPLSQTMYTMARGEANPVHMHCLTCCVTVISVCVDWTAELALKSAALCPVASARAAVSTTSPVSGKPAESSTVAVKTCTLVCMRRRDALAALLLVLHGVAVAVCVSLALVCSARRVGFCTMRRMFEPNWALIAFMLDSGAALPPLTVNVWSCTTLALQVVATFG
jgi:hypothetical protein